MIFSTLVVVNTVFVLKINCNQIKTPSPIHIVFQVDIDTVALINDTTGTLLAVAGNKFPDCHVGLILGTGTNVCYMEKFDAATMPKFRESLATTPMSSSTVSQVRLVTMASWISGGLLMTNSLTRSSRRLKLTLHGEQL